MRRDCVWTGSGAGWKGREGTGGGADGEEADGRDVLIVNRCDRCCCSHWLVTAPVLRCRVMFAPRHQQARLSTRVNTLPCPSIRAYTHEICCMCLLMPNCVSQASSTAQTRQDGARDSKQPNVPFSLLVPSQAETATCCSAGE